MPRASWRGFLGLSLVSCPIYLSPATSRTKPIRLHQVWRRASVEEPEDGSPDRGREEQLDERPALHNGAGEDADRTEGATRITLRGASSARCRTASNQPASKRSAKVRISSAWR